MTRHTCAATFLTQRPCPPEHSIKQVRLPRIVLLCHDEAHVAVLPAVLQLLDAPARTSGHCGSTCKRERAGLQQTHVGCGRRQHLYTREGWAAAGQQAHVSARAAAAALLLCAGHAWRRSGRQKGERSSGACRASLLVQLLRASALGWAMACATTSPPYGCMGFLRAEAW